MNIPTIILAIWIAAFLGNRFIMTNALKKLDDQTKLKILDVFPRRNNYFTIVLVAIIVIYFGAIQYYPQYNVAITTTYICIYLIYSLVKSVMDYRKLKQIDASSDYLRSYIIACSIFILGLSTVAGMYLLEIMRF